MHARRLACLVLTALATVTIRDGMAADPPRFAICFCTTEGHASVHLIDGSTGQQHGRGLYDIGHSSGKNAPTIPYASDPASQEPGAKIPAGADTQGLDLVAIDTYGVLQDDDGIAGKKCVCHELTMGEYNQAVSFVNTYEHRYNVATQNCVSFVTDTAEHLGKWTPKPHPPEPAQFYWLMNAVMKVLQGYPDGGAGHRQSKGYSFIGYADPEALEKYFGKFAKPAALGHGRPALANREKERHAEELLLSPDVLYRAIVQGGAVPSERQIAVSGGSGRRCGEGCVEAGAGATVTFSPQTPFSGESLVWWDFGDGYDARVTQAVHVFRTGGLHRVRLRAIDEKASPWYGAMTVLVTGAPLPSSAGLDTEAPAPTTQTAVEPVLARDGEAPAGASVLVPQLMFPGGRIEGVVVSSDDRPVAGAGIIAGTVTGEEKKLRSDRDGRFVYLVPERAAEVAFRLAAARNEQPAAVLVPAKPAGSAPPPATGPGPYVKPGDHVDVPYELERVTLEQGSSSHEAPVAKAVSSDGFRAVSAFAIPGRAEPGPLHWRLDQPGGGSKSGSSRVYHIKEARIDDSKLRSGQIADFAFDLDFGPGLAGRKVCASVNVSGPVDLVKPPAECRIGTAGTGKVQGKVQARLVARGTPIPFSIQLHVADCGTAGHR